PVRYTRRRFLETTGALAAGAGHAIGFGQQPASRPGAPGVELNIDTSALPDYSRDLERYLVRVANEARDRRKRIIDAVSTRQAVLDRKKGVYPELGKIVGGPSDRPPPKARVVGPVGRPGNRTEKAASESRPRLYVTANLYVPAGTGRRPGILAPLGH